MKRKTYQDGSPPPYGSSSAHTICSRSSRRSSASTTSSWCSVPQRSASAAPAAARQRRVLRRREAERVRPRRPRPPPRAARYRARVEPARERHRDRNVGERPAHDRVAQRVAQPLRPVSRSSGANSSRHQHHVVKLPVVEVVAERVRRRQAQDPVEDRPLARDEPQRQVVQEALAVELALDARHLQERPQLRTRTRTAPRAARSRAA